jgi:hypothetical protein
MPAQQAAKGTKRGAGLAAQPATRVRVTAVQAVIRSR